MNKDQVVAQIEDWERRLEALYTQIDDWFKGLPPCDQAELFEGSVLQHDEPPMRYFEIPPRMLPTRSIVYGANRLSFVPSALWIKESIGRGRVNISTDRHQFALIDKSSSDANQSEWRIITSPLRETEIPFDQEIFNNLVRHQLIEAA